MATATARSLLADRRAKGLLGGDVDGRVTATLGGEKVQRRMPSALDVAFSVLGNDIDIGTAIGTAIGDDRVLYAGPTMSHYELATTGVERIADSEWEAKVDKGELPARPDWTQAYLIG